jgi:hypothetical protein
MFPKTILIKKAKGMNVYLIFIFPFLLNVTINTTMDLVKTIKELARLGKLCLLLELLVFHEN